MTEKSKLKDELKTFEDLSWWQSLDGMPGFIYVIIAIIVLHIFYVFFFLTFPSMYTVFAVSFLVGYYQFSRIEKRKQKIKEKISKLK